MIINRNNPIVETDFANVEVHITEAGVEGLLISIIWQDERYVEDVGYFQTMHEAWKEAYSVYRYEQRLHPEDIIALIY